MDWRRSRESENVVRAGAIGPGGLGIGATVVVALVALALGGSPAQILSLLLDTRQMEWQDDGELRTSPPPDTEDVAFVRSILGSTEDTWDEIFRATGRGYPRPRLVLFDGAVDSACGRASASVGPFDCSADQQVYLDLAFFEEMEEQFHAAGDLARAYVIAHEIGHHVQNVTGVTDAADRMLRRGATTEGAEGLSVRLELQADCYAGVWANRSEQRLRWLEPGDVEKALAAATAIGDDALQLRSQGYAVPDSFTHGTSEQRERWFKNGLERGRVEDCDTMRAARL